MSGAARHPKSPVVAPARGSEIQRCGVYIRSLELRLCAPHLGWETFLLTERLPAEWLFWGVRAIFAVSAMLAIVGSLVIEIPQGSTAVFW